MLTVSGVWKWNDVISAIPGKHLYINFTSNSKSFIQMIVERDVAGNVLFYVEDVTTTYVDAYNLYDNTWTNEAYKTIDLGTEPQEVSEDFYTYLTANATKQEEPVAPTTTKTVSSDNLARFKQKCDETYAGKDEIQNVPAIHTPTTSDNGKVLGVTNGAYALQAAGTIWYHHSISDGAGGYLDFWNTYANPYTSETLSNINTSPRIPVAAKSPDTSGWPNNTIYIAYLEVDSNGELRVYYFDSDHTLQTLAFPWGGDTVTLY